MKRALIRCDGASAPASLKWLDWDITEDLRHRGSRANLNLSVQSPSHALLTSVTDSAADLMRIASYVYAADQMVSRGGKADVYGDSWQRHFAVCIPVNDLALWSDSRVSLALEEVLSFASEDRWSFSFSQASPEEQQLPFDVEPNTSLGDPDAVFLFSGGVDSLCAVVEAFAVHRKKPLLLGHSPAFHIASRQRELARALRERFSQVWHFPYLSVAIHRTDSDPRDYTQRTRSFLYASLGAVIADRLGLPEVGLPDNGVVSLNLPTNAQLLGAKASRTTHPRFFRLFDEFASLVLPGRPKLANPLWARTRAEGLDVLKKANAVELLQETNSCSHQRNLTAMRPHCGVCLQCIDRRFATLAADLEEHDMADRYELDFFRDHLPEGDARTTVMSYVRFAIEVAEMTDEGFFARFPELYDALAPNDPDQRETAERLTCLLRRHGATILQVVENQIGRARRELARQQLPPTCLIRLLAASGEPQAAPDFRPGPGYREVWLRGEKFDLTPNQARVVQLLHQNDGDGNLGASQAYILEELEIKSKNLYQVFRGSPAWGRLIVPADGKGMYRLNF